MKIEIKYNKHGEMEFKGTPTKEEKKLYGQLKNAANNFYKTVESILEEGTLEIKIKKEEK